MDRFRLESRPAYRDRVCLFYIVDRILDEKRRRLGVVGLATGTAGSCDPPPLFGWVGDLHRF